jgi:hypothetical protein
MTSRRAFLGWSGLVGWGVLAHHRPGHRGGPPATTTTTTTLPPAGGCDVYSDVYSDSC